MRKIVTCCLLATAALSSATPTFADNDSSFGSGANAPNNWNLTAADVCIQELAVVPALSDWSGNHENNCSNGMSSITPAAGRSPATDRNLITERFGRARHVGHGRVLLPSPYWVPW